MHPRHDSACGTRIEPLEMEGPAAARCTHCGAAVEAHPVPSAAAVVRRGRRVLLVRRRSEGSRAPWSLPCGRQRHGETVETTAVREARQAAGLLVRMNALLDVLAHDDPPGAGLMVVYEVHEVGGELDPGPVHAEAAFLDLDDLPRDVAFRSHRAVLESLRTGNSRW